ncbi:energy-coupling factor ABC transporter ATP-binding protein [Halocatena salina]|uniref:Energy-coupling factor ABC transporter ATP-binding protein n=1 Tax=Halocatena salina TaxID=2934340 RepID=A0A8U0A7A3_9EURY|nr:ABC transporter ATP-binding protein [Halocatena salina]UPM45081.1 energy-coupling factor ABC transporter ATP-binding protein [Halocatena salina]
MIEINNLTFRYERRSGDSGERSVLDDVSLTIDDGSFVVLAGPNGSGKTTLVRHFNGLLDSDEGWIAVNGQRVGEDVVAARTAVAMTFQDPRDGFVAATVAEDVAFGPVNLGLEREQIDQRVQEALVAVQMDGFEQKRIDRLSGGEQARVAIAGALAMRPDHLVLDEPFVGLDEPARQSVLERLRALSAEGMSIIVVTHDLRELLDLADRLVVMSEGQIVLDGSPETVLDRLSEREVSVPC